MLMQTHDATIIDEFEKLGRTRALTDEESLQLERAIRSSSRKAQRPWLPKDDLALRKAVRKRKKLVAIAAEMERSVMAVAMRMSRLRKLGKVGYLSLTVGSYRRKCLGAGDGPDGV